MARGDGNGCDGHDGRRREGGFRRLARFSYRRRRLVLGASVLALVGLIWLGNVAGGAYRTQFSGLPGSESQQATEILRSGGFTPLTGEQDQVVFRGRQGVNDPQVRRAVSGLLVRIQRSVRDVEVVSPYSGQGAEQIAPGEKIAYAQLNLGNRPRDGYSAAADRIQRARDAVHVPGLRIELGGQMFTGQGGSATEGIAILFAVFILLIAFGSVLAMGLPITTALFGIGSGLALVALVANLMDMPGFTGQAGAMIGIGVGIDYALFIVTRYREALRGGRPPEEAVVQAIDTSGRAVLFAGTTVIISLLGLFVTGLPMIRGLAVGAALAVLMTMVASLTLLPALLGFVGRNIDRLRVPLAGRRRDPARTWSFRWSRVVQRRPVAALIGALVIVVTLAVPVFSIRLGFSDAGSNPASDTTRQAYDLLSEGFGPGFNGPLVLAAKTPGGRADVGTLQRLSAELNHTHGVAYASPPVGSPSGSAAVMFVVPTTAPQDQATSNLVNGLRDVIVPRAIAGSTAMVKVGGATAGVVDFASYTAHRLPVLIGVVLALSFLLLMMVFRSVLVPLKAVVVNLLSIGAAYGLIVAVFQWGWGKGLIGVGKAGPVEAWAPMMIFAIVFGLSMDYEVFLLSRIREEYDRTGDNAASVGSGLAATARVITAAAAIMVSVFGSFALGPDRAIKLFGLGLAAAVLIDATLVRLVLVPATMELLGWRNWWLPRWLDRILPRVHVQPEVSPGGELDRLAPAPAMVGE
jgi:putative drug exporter of the RND superfamily